RCVNRPVGLRVILTSMGITGGGRRLMTDLAQGQVTRPRAARPSRAIADQSGSRPTPSAVRPAAVQQTPMQQEPMKQQAMQQGRAQREAGADSGRATARAALDA